MLLLFLVQEKPHLLVEIRQFLFEVLVLPVWPSRFVLGGVMVFELQLDLVVQFFFALFLQCGILFSLQGLPLEVLLEFLFFSHA